MSLLRYEDIPAERPIFSGQYGNPAKAQEASVLGSLGALWVRTCDQLFRLPIAADASAVAKRVQGEGAACVPPAQQPLDESRASEMLKRELRGSD